MIDRLLNIILLVLLLVAAPALEAAQVQVQEDPPAVSQPAESTPAVSNYTALILIGTAVSSDPAISLAVIADSSTGSVRSYHEGDPIGDLVIGEIERETVILESAGGDRVLTMTGGGGFRRSDQVLQASDLSQGPTTSTTSVTSEEIAKAVPDYMDMMRTIRIRPYLEAGRPGGVLVYNIEPKSIFARMGLVDGDVIKAVNGEGLKTTRDAIEFYHTIREAGTVTLVIKRGEETEELKFEIL